MDNPDKKVFKYEGETGVFFTKEYIDSILNESKDFLEITDAIFEKINDENLQIEKFILMLKDRGTIKIGPYEFIVSFYKKDVDEYLTLKKYPDHIYQASNYDIRIYMYVPIKTDDISYMHSTPICTKGEGNLKLPVSETIPSLHNILEILGVYYKEYLDELYKLLLDMSKLDMYKNNNIDISNNVNFIAITCNNHNYVLALNDSINWLNIVNGSVTVNVYEIVKDSELEKYKTHNVLEKELPLTYGKRFYNYSLEELLKSIVKFSN